MNRKIKADRQAQDLQLLALLVARRLRQEHRIDAAPNLADYTVTGTTRFPAAGAELHLDVDLGRGVRARIEDAWWKDGDRDTDSLLRLAEDFSNTIADLLGQAADLRAMLSEVKAAARREIARANRRGLAYALSSVALAPLQAGNRDDAFVSVVFTGLARSLRPEVLVIDAVCAEDVGQAFANVQEEQSRRFARRADLDRLGATGAIDAVVAAALDDAGVDVGAVLAKLCDTDGWFVDVEAVDGRSFTLHWDEGIVFSRVVLGEGVSWHKDQLWFDKSPEAIGTAAAGSPLSKLYPHPFLDERLIVRSAHGSKGEHATIRCDQALLAFDADSGRMWPA